MDQSQTPGNLGDWQNMLGQKPVEDLDEGRDIQQFA
jgi:hypothetical protein